MSLCFFSIFFNATATTDIYTLSLHDALPIYVFADELRHVLVARHHYDGVSHFRHACSYSSNDIVCFVVIELAARDRKSTRLNSSHVAISYAVFCLKKKKKKRKEHKKTANNII